MLTYAVNFTSRYDGLVVVSFPDVPDAVGYGRDDEEAREDGLRALERALQCLVDGGEEPPVPRARGSQTVTTSRFREAALA